MKKPRPKYSATYRLMRRATKHYSWERIAAICAVSMPTVARLVRGDTDLRYDAALKLERAIARREK